MPAKTRRREPAGFFGGAINKAGFYFRFLRALATAFWPSILASLSIDRFIHKAKLNQYSISNSACHIKPLGAAKASHVQQMSNIRA
jgi:hypothetical protein